MKGSGIARFGRALALSIDGAKALTAMHAIFKSELSFNENLQTERGYSLTFVLVSEISRRLRKYVSLTVAIQLRLL